MYGRVGIPKSVILGADAFVMSPNQLFSIFNSLLTPRLGHQLEHRLVGASAVPPSCSETSSSSTR